MLVDSGLVCRKCGTRLTAFPIHCCQIHYLSADDGAYYVDRSGPCIHRGPELRRESCPTCDGKVELKIFGCSLHGECSLPRSSVKQCATCEDYSRYKPPAPGAIRVGFVSPVFFFPGGVEEWIISLASRFNDTIFCSGLAVLNPNVAKINVDRFEKIAPVMIGEKNVQKLSDESDVLIIWGLGNLKSILPHTKCKTILTLHGTSGWTEDFAKSTGPLVDMVVGVSEQAQSLWPGAYVIPNGVDLSRCVPLNRERGMMRAKWGLKSGDKALGYVGRLVGDKDPLAIARAVAVLGEDWKAVFCGNNPEGLVDQANKIVPGRVVHIPPVVRVAEVLGSLDCMMIVSAHEGFCLALVDAWAAGVPTVCTSIGGVPEAEERFGQITFRVPYQAPAAELARAVQQITSVGFAEVVERAKYAAQTYYNADRMAEDWLKVIQELVNDPR